MVSPAEAELGNPVAGCGVEGKSRAPEQELLSWLGTCLRWELGAAPHPSNGLSDRFPRWSFVTALRKGSSCLWVAFQLAQQSLDPI